jgi:hypothetical protein
MTNPTRRAMTVIVFAAAVVGSLIFAHAMYRTIAIENHRAIGCGAC